MYGCTIRNSDWFLPLKGPELTAEETLYFLPCSFFSVTIILCPYHPNINSNLHRCQLLSSFVNLQGFFFDKLLNVSSFENVIKCDLP